MKQTAWQCLHLLIISYSHRLSMHARLHPLHSRQTRFSTFPAEQAQALSRPSSLAMNLDIHTSATMFPDMMFYVNQAGWACLNAWIAPWVHLSNAYHSISTIGIKKASHDPKPNEICNKIRTGSSPTMENPSSMSMGLQSICMISCIWPSFSPTPPATPVFMHTWGSGKEFNGKRSTLSCPMTLVSSRSYSAFAMNQFQFLRIYIFSSLFQLSLGLGSPTWV